MRVLASGTRLRVAFVLGDPNRVASELRAKLLSQPAVPAQAELLPFGDERARAAMRPPSARAYQVHTEA